MHAFATETPELCEGQENCEQNNCRACGGESECHSEPQAGPCHEECDCSPELDMAHEIEALEEALASLDVELIAAVILEAESVEYNSERKAVQVVGCGRVVRHEAVDDATADALLNVLNAEAVPNAPR